MAHFTRTIIIYRASHSVFTSTSKTDEKPREIDAKLPLDFVPRFFALFQKYIFGLALGRTLFDKCWSWLKQV